MRIVKVTNKAIAVLRDVKRSQAAAIATGKLTEISSAYCPLTTFVRRTHERSIPAHPLFGP